jgi:hypothetical protein
MVYMRRLYLAAFDCPLTLSTYAGPWAPLYKDLSTAKGEPPYIGQWVPLGILSIFVIAVFT